MSFANTVTLESRARWRQQETRGFKNVVGAGAGRKKEWRERELDVLGRVVPQEEQDGGCSSLDVTGGRAEQQCRADFCVPKYARDSFYLTTSVESGFLVDGSSGASREEGLALGAVG